MAGEQVRRLAELLSQMSGKAGRPDEIFKEILAIFEKLVLELEGASAERKSELLTEMQEMSALLELEAPKLFEAAELTESEVFTQVSNPQSFTEEQWLLLHLGFDIVQDDLTAERVVADTISNGHKVHRCDHIIAVGAFILIQPMDITAFFRIPKTAFGGGLV